MKKLVFFLVFTSVSFADTVIRVAFDIGSGSMKLKIAKVDTEKQKILEILFPKDGNAGNAKVPYQATLRDSFIPAKTAKEGLAALMKLQIQAMGILNKVESKEKVQVSGVATGVFRSAKNAKDIINNLIRETGIPIRIVSQEEEAKIGFLAALQHKEISPNNLVVWDIGGATLQISGYSQEGMNGFLYYGSTVASETFKGSLMEEFKKKGSSPNPISKEEMSFGLAWVKKSSETLPDGLAAKIKDPKVTVVGIGGVLSISVKNQVQKKEKETYSVQDIKEKLTARLGLKDEQIGGKFADTEISNLILVLGLMERFQILKVEPVVASNADGILVHPDFWK